MGKDWKDAVDIALINKEHPRWVQTIAAGTVLDANREIVTLRNLAHLALEYINGNGDYDDEPLRKACEDYWNVHSPR